MDKTERLLRMMEHPEKYSEEEWQELLADEDCHELYEAMRLSADAFEMKDAQAKLSNGLKEEEWQKFEAKHYRGERREGSEELRVGSEELRVKSEESNLKSQTSNLKSQISNLKSQLRKIAATIVGILMLSGIAYAAIHLWKGSPNSITKNEKSEYVQVTDTTNHAVPLSTGKEVGNDTIIFEDTELHNILREVATFYQCETIYKNEKVKHVRLYFTWDKTSEIDDVIEMFNRFDRIHITRENQRLIVK